eukprot:364240-Chlamydomonas_euryale.AAC.6
MNCPGGASGDLLYCGWRRTLRLHPAGSPLHFAAPPWRLYPAAPPCSWISCSLPWQHYVGLQDVRPGG